MVGSETHDLVPCWGVHSSKDEKPVFRDWARTEALALEKIEQLKVEDRDNPEDEYWVAQMTRGEFDSYKENGLLPHDA